MSLVVDHPPVVVDASVAVDLAIGARPDVPQAWQRWIEQDRMVLAPAIFWTEVGHVLLRLRGDEPVDATERMAALEAVGIEIADRRAGGVRMAMSLARRHGLSVYDATYLLLAIDVGGELATFDRALAAAATAEGVPVSMAA